MQPVGFVVAHLVGNLTIFLGPQAFNDYAHKIESLGPLVWVMRAGMIAAVIVHVSLTLTLVFENRAARPQPYHRIASKGNRSWATRTMAYTGLLIIAFLIMHLYDFTFATKDGPQSIIEGVNNGESSYLFGLVWFSFNQWWRMVFYVVAVAAVGAHLSHALQSVCQTFGMNHERYTPWVKGFSIAVGVLVAVGFASLPIYVFLASEPMGV